MCIEAKLAEMNLTLPPPSPKGGVYQSMLVVGDQALFSGHVPVMPDGSMLTGRVGDEVDLEAAQVAARQVGLASARLDGGQAQRCAASAFVT